MTHGWAYVLPRAVIVLVGWGATYFILTAISTQLPTAVIYITGIVWMSAGVLCFGYLYRLFVVVRTGPLTVNVPPPD